MNYKERDPVLVDSYDQAVEKNEIALGMKLDDLKKDLTDIWGKLDDIINNRTSTGGHRTLRAPGGTMTANAKHACKKQRYWIYFCTP